MDSAQIASKLGHAAPSNAPDAGTVGNFILGECFADVRCRHGHPTRLFNIGRGHYVACDCCRTFLFVGSNLMSSWRNEDMSVWQASRDTVRGYEFLE